MASGILHVGAIGVEIRIPLLDNEGNRPDLRTASTITLLLKKPAGGATLVKPATKVGTGQLGEVYYLTVAGDIDVAGAWQAQVRVQSVTPLRDWYTQIYPLEVASHL